MPQPWLPPSFSPRRALSGSAFPGLGEPGGAPTSSRGCSRSRAPAPRGSLPAAPAQPRGNEHG